MSFSKEQIDALRESVRERMSEWRFTHTAEVEKMAVRLGELYLPERLDILSAAALLHDITKEKSTDEHLTMLKTHGRTVTPIDEISPKTLHAKTAELLIGDEYAEFAAPELILAVRRHTTGSADMTLLDKIIYLADYIDESRKFEDCVKLREYFWSAEVQKMSYEQRIEHLNRTLLLSFDMTLNALISEGAPISPDTIKARNAIICALKK